MLLNDEGGNDECFLNITIVIWCVCQSQYCFFNLLFFIFNFTAIFWYELLFLLLYLQIILLKCIIILLLLNIPIEITISWQCDKKLHNYSKCANLKNLTIFTWITSVSKLSSWKKGWFQFICKWALYFDSWPWWHIKVRWLCVPSIDQITIQTKLIFTDGWKK